MKILTLSNCPLNEVTGSGYVITGFANELKARGHKVDLFGPDDYELLNWLKTGTIYKKALGMMLCTLRQLKNNRYDVVEFYGMESWLAVAALAGLPGKRPLLVSHSNGLEPHSSELLLKQTGSYRLDGQKPSWYHNAIAPLLETAFRSVDGIVTVSDFDLDFAESRGYQDKSHLVSIENSLAPEFLGKQPNFQRPPAIGFCGSWLERKGISFIIPAIVQILDEFAQATFKVAGVGHDFKPSDYFPDRLLPRIETTPYITSKQELLHWYESTAILILPSIYESFGLAAAEAMASGCALVATKVGFAYSLVDKKEAMIVALTATALADGIRTLLSNNELLIEIARNGHQRVQHLRWDKASEKLIDTYAGWLRERVP